VTGRVEEAVRLAAAPGKSLFTPSGRGRFTVARRARRQSGRRGVSIPSKVAGVYEVRSADNDSDERTYIGKAGDLRLRVR